MSQESPALVPLLIGITVALAISWFATWLILRRRIRSALQRTNEAQIEVARLGERVNELGQKATELPHYQACLRDETGKKSAFEALAEERAQEIVRLREELSSSKNQAQNAVNEQSNLRVELAGLTKTLESEKSHIPDKIDLLNNAEQKFSATFEALANRILEAKSKRFTEQNQENLNHLLSPLKTKIDEFQQQVEHVYDVEGKERSALANQVSLLMELNQQLSQEANNLTRALKGSGKTQGTFGEYILEQILESSGLRKGEDFHVRETYTREDGRRAQPDVVINMPGGRHLVVDSKASVTDYVNFASADTDAARESALGSHLDSVWRHVKQLSDKNYQELYDLKSIDFVIMFVPVEPAFMLAISRDSELCEKAWKKNVLLVSPSTLLFVVRTVAFLWRQEQASQNVRDIAKRGGELYDKLVGFVDSLNLVGRRLRQASQSFDDARGKLVEGHGNLIRQAEMLRELGVKPTKTLPPDLLDSAFTEQPVVLPRLVASAGYSEGMEELEFPSNEDIPF